GASTLGMGTLSSGTASLNVSSLAVGAGHSLTAEYGGNAGYSASTSSATPYTVNPASTTTSVGSDVNPSLAGQMVTFTATIAAVSPGAGTPSGTVQFKIDGSNAGSPATVSGAMAS